MYLVTKTVINPAEHVPSELFEVISRRDENTYHCVSVQSVDYHGTYKAMVHVSSVLRTFDNETDAVLWYDRYARLYQQYKSHRDSLARQLVEIDAAFSKEFQ